MVDTVRVVECFYIKVPNKTGEGARALATLRNADVNLLAFSGFPVGRQAKMDFIPADSGAFKQAAKQAKWKVIGPRRCFLVQGDDRVGAIADLLERLAAAKISVTAMDAVSVGDGRHGAIFWVDPKDVKKVASLLGASAAA